MATPLEVVEDFLAAWPAADASRLASFFSDDAVYHNIPMEAIHGRAAIEAALAGFVGGVSKIRFDTVHIAAAGDVVLTERVDRFIKNGRDVAVPLMGIFEVRDGRITAWRDYFDLQQFLAQTS